jgi:polyisoprenoid-binding protein YceI
MQTINKNTWAIDPAHSEIHFKVRHLVIATVTGSFTKFEGSLVTAATDFSDAVITFSASVDSINTNVPDRDAHLKSAEFFDAANHPEIRFRSKRFVKEEDNNYQLVGDITIRGVTKEVKLRVEFGGTMKDPWGNEKAGFSLAGKLSRKEFGLQWNAMTEAGGAVAGDEVKLELNVEMVKQV